MARRQAVAGSGHVDGDVGTIETVQRIERKFFIWPRNTGFAHVFLRQVCRPDRDYPQGQINTLYFDTPELEQYMRSASGDFRKDKVRIRWYGSLGDYGKTVPVYLELKTRQGYASSKQRQRFLVPAQDLGTATLGKGIIEKAALVDALATFGHYPKSPLRPVILISYWRYRFNEMFTGVRVSLDLRIRSTVVAGGIGIGERDLELRGGVVEVKGPKLELPATLQRMKLLETDWSRFSKYGQCVDAHLEQPGLMARLWPSGRATHTI